MNVHDDIVVFEIMESIKTYLGNKKIVHKISFTNQKIKCEIKKDIGITSTEFKKIYNSLNSLVSSSQVDMATMIIHGETRQEFIIKQA